MRGRPLPYRTGALYPPKPPARQESCRSPDPGRLPLDWTLHFEGETRISPCLFFYLRRPIDELQNSVAELNQIIQAGDDDGFDDTQIRSLVLMNDGIAEVDHILEFFREGHINDELLPQEVKTFRAGGRDAHLIFFYQMVGQVDSLFTGPENIEEGGILLGEIASKTVWIRAVFFPRASDATLNALDFIGNEIIHTA